MSIVVSMFGELLILIIFGMILYPAGSLWYKFLWTMVFCGVGMGATVGAMLDLFVVERLSGWPAILATLFLYVLVLGIACDVLCLHLDLSHQWFGGGEHPTLFIVNGILMSAIGGLLVGFLLFTKTGSRLFKKLETGDKNA